MSITKAEMLVLNTANDTGQLILTSAGIVIAGIETENFRLREELASEHANVDNLREEVKDLRRELASIKQQGDPTP